MKTLQCRVTNEEYEKIQYLLSFEQISSAEFLRAFVISKILSAEKKNPTIWNEMEQERIFHEEMRKKYIK